MDGGIFGLLGLIREHRGAVEYDWRTKFGKPLDEVGRSMSIVEAARLAQCLIRDTTTQTFVAINGWEFAASREYLLLADQYDLLHRANAEKPDRVKPYPRPWPDRSSEQMGTTIPVHNIADVLAAFGRPVPEGLVA